MNKILSNLFWIVIISAIGLFAINQWLEYRYNAFLLQKPCELCAKLNQNQSMCIANCFTQTVRVYYNGLDGWCGEDGYKYIGNEKQKEKCEIQKTEELNLTSVLQNLRS